MKVDLHVHSAEHSNCAISTEREQIEAAIAIGLDGIAFTDHHYQRSAKYLKELNEKYKPFKIFTGIEIRTTDTDEDVIILGVPEMELHLKKRWTYENLYKFARSFDGAIILPHPYRFAPEVYSNVETFVPDAIEIMSTNIKPHLYNRITELCDNLGTPPIATSDAHISDHVGKFYVTLSNSVHNDAELVNMIKNFKYEMR